MLDTLFHPFNYFLSPWVSFGVALLFGAIYILALFCRLSLGFGRAGVLLPVPIAWFFCWFWAVLKIGKTYSPSWDVQVLYPSLFFISILLTTLWGVTLIRHMRSAEDQRGNGAASPFAWTLHGILAPILDGISLVLPIEKILAQPLLVLGGGIGLSLLGGTVGGMRASEFMRGFLVAGMISLILVTLIGVTLFAVFLWNESMSKRRAILDELLPKMQALADATDGAKVELELLEADALPRIHALSSDFGDRLGRVKSIFQALNGRVELIEEMVNRGGEVDISAADELSRIEIEMGQDTKSELVTSGIKLLKLHPDQWVIAAKQCHDEAVSLRSELKRLFP